MDNHVGYYIALKRKELGFTQQKLAEKLNISFQAVSKWENGTSAPDISLLPQIAHILNTSVDALVGYNHAPKTVYEEKYKNEEYYWGIAPSKMCYDIMQLKPPVKPLRVLDIGCGEGKNAVFFARNGYKVSAFDIADAGLDKVRRLAEHNHVDVDFFKTDIIDIAPDMEEIEKKTESWHSGELFGYYHDWLFHKNDETIFDCNSGGMPHRHCMNILIAEKVL